MSTTQVNTRRTRTPDQGTRSVNLTPFLAGAAASALLVAALRIYRSRTLQRIPSPEGIEDPAVAQGFERIQRLPHMALMRRLIARQAVSLAEQGVAVDLGCGAGTLAVELARQGPMLRVIGVDLSGELLAKAEANARESGLGGQVTFRLGDIHDLPFPDESLDLVISTLSLHHWSDPQAVLDEIARVLRPGGGYLIADLRRDLSAPFYLLIWLVTHFVVPRALRYMQEPLASRNASYTPLEVARMVSNSRLTGWIVRRGPLWVMLYGHK